VQIFLLSVFKVNHPFYEIKSGKKELLEKNRKKAVVE